MKTVKVCRPCKITNRWLIEMSRALSNVSKEPFKINPVLPQDCNNHDNNFLFEKFMSENKVAIENCPICIDILSFSIDYNDFL